jgi:adenosine deaminase
MIFTQVDQRTRHFIAGLPKAELHVHIEGTLTPTRRWEIAARNGIRLPYADITALTASMGFEAPDAPTYLQKFLAAYYEGIEVLRTPEDFRDLTVDYLTNCRDERVLYAELSFDPQAHTSRGVALAAVMEGLAEGRRIGRQELGVETNLILCINRDRPVDTAVSALTEARKFRDQIMGIGLDSDELYNPPAKFRAVYDLARSEGYRLTAHCDVDQPATRENIRQCLDILKVERIDHGINAIEDPALVDEARARGITFTTCPTWRQIDTAPRRVDRIRKMYDQGLKVTLNTDDPGLFASGTMGKMLPAVMVAGGFTFAEMAQLMINAFEGAWIDDGLRHALLGRTREYMLDWGNDK